MSSPPSSTTSKTNPPFLSLLSEPFSFLEKYSKVILEGYGAGGIPIRLEKVVQKLMLSGTKVYITTQCLEGGADLTTYEVGRRAEAMGAICLGHRTTEDAIAAIQCGDI